jgi:hypothetical protein
MKMNNVTTDNKWKQFKYGNEVPDKVLSENFDWLEEKTDGFFVYRKSWYHVSEFMNVPDTETFKGWDGYSSDSAFSGVLIKISKDGEEYKIGTFNS